VEAMIGDTVCGRHVVAPVVMVFDSPGSYELAIASAKAIPACTAGAPVTFRIDGKTVPQTGTNVFSRQGQALDLTVP
jgi:hypothetical protein